MGNDQDRTHECKRCGGVAQHWLEMKTKDKGSTTWLCTLCLNELRYLFSRVILNGAVATTQMQNGTDKQHHFFVETKHESSS